MAGLLGPSSLKNDMMKSSNITPHITLHPQAPTSSNGLDVILRFIASGRKIPRNGGTAGNSGTAFFEIDSNSPRTIWCVVPAFDGGHSRDLLMRALLQGLQRAAIHDHRKVGIELVPVSGSPIPPETIATLVVRGVRQFVGDAFQLEEFRLISHDATMFTTAQNLVSLHGE